MEWTTIGMAVFTTVLIPTGGWLIRTTVNNSAKLDAHEKEDTIHFKNIAERLTDVQNGQKAQSEKLDRLIERFL